MKVGPYSRLLRASIVWVMLLPAVSNAQAVRDNRVPRAAATTVSSDALLATGEWERSSGGITGGGGSLDWLHTARPGTNVSLGLATYRLGDSQRTLGRAGAFFPLADRWTLEPQVTLGGGNTAGAGFLYQQYRARLGFRASSRLYIKAQEEYLNIGDSNGHLLSGGVSVLPSRLLFVDVSYAHSVGGNLGTEFVSGRFDLYQRTLRPFAGFAVGQTAPVVFDVGFGQQLMAQDLREGFVGFVFPIAAAEFTVALDWIQVGSAQRSTFTAGVKIPIRANSRLRSTP